MNEILDTLENNDSNTIHSTEHWTKLDDRKKTKLKLGVSGKQNTALISSWIDRKESTYELNSIPYEFKLISHGSRDGKIQAFKDRCTGRDLQNEPILSRVAKSYVIVHQFMIVWVLVVIYTLLKDPALEKIEIINSTTFTIEDFEIFKIIRIH
ncbi:hypothetical protein Glove_522g39 [Diversispora epigaea]|uniref:Uncharacterized protein n=1 Tax=Diversispora epigaea TaxID=1348612 RepID=A0A397GIU7_9GLOM|nr:hypothetical protein Glove_522g39 [Diversispora epigaea]